MKYITFLLENKVHGSHVNLVKREALLQDLRVARSILFPIENEKKCISIQNAFIVTFISWNSLFQTRSVVTWPLSVSLRIVILVYYSLSQTNNRYRKRCNDQNKRQFYYRYEISVYFYFDTIMLM